MICSKCRSGNGEDQKFCGNCGTALLAIVREPVPGDEGAFYCARHKKTSTRLHCGRCETPVCPRCVVQSPAGIRCRDCARNRLPVRAGGVLHEAGRALENSANSVGGNRIWYLALCYFIFRAAENPCGLSLGMNAALPFRSGQGAKARYWGITNACSGNACSGTV